MDTKKVLLATLAGGVVNFLLGGLIYGMLLKDFYASNVGTATGVMRADEAMQQAPLLLGCFLGAFLFTYIFARWASIRTAASGMAAGAVIGLLMSASYNFTMLGVTNINNTTATIVDSLVGGVFGALIGATVGWVLGYGEKRD